ncbi:N-6 DNA methylase [Micromonospora sp. NBC_00898]|uniref:N-6 DNA methylase n=1 Tax=Micromonospora sp. NBC_00898 TaxID=2975981 RepID=UPI003869FCAA|nr:N-6 DNA methylase [Micromonospora sp. NBC_00898]
MPDAGEVLVSRADIARLAGVRRPAVTNWERRYPDFPVPVKSGDGVDHFRAEDVAGWLESRRIPRSARWPSEPEGVSYGERFRRSLTTADDPSAAETAAPHQAMLGAQLYDFFWAAVLDDVLRPEEYRDLLLTLIHAAARRPEHWSDLRRAVQAGDDVFLPALQFVLGVSDAGPFTELFGSVVLTPRHTEAVRTIIGLIDREPGPAGGARTQQLQHLFTRVLERYVERAGKRAGELFTPPSVTRLATRMLAATGVGTSLYDPYCRSGEFLSALAAECTEAGVAQSMLRVEGVAQQAATRRVAELQLSLHGVEADLRGGLALAHHQFLDHRHDLVVCNPPFNARLAEHLLTDRNWAYGDPPPHNGNLAWLQHALAALDGHGRAAVLLPNNAATSARPAERKIRAALVEEGVVACLVALPSNLFAGTAVPVTLWLLDKQRRHPGEVLFIDATSAGRMVARSSRILTDYDISELVATFARWWRAEPGQPFDAQLARRVPAAEIREQNYSLNPAFYVEQPATPRADLRPEDVGPLSAELHRLRRVAQEAGDQAAAMIAAAYGQSARSAPRTRDSLIGAVPADWQRLTLRQLAEIQIGPQLPRDPSSGSGVPIVNPRDLRDGWIAGDGLDVATDVQSGLVRRYGLMPGDILCVRTGELGRHGLARAEQQGWLFSPGLFRVRPGRDVVPEFLAHYLGLPQVRMWIRRQGSGTAVPNIQGRVLGELPIVLPPIAVQQQVGVALAILQDEARRYDQLVRTAGRLRETLVPLLMTGTLLAP